MQTISELLDLANIQYAAYAPSGPKQVYLTLGNQLIGAFNVLESYRRGDCHYHGWHAHHVVEDQDLERLHIAHLSPAYREQLCVMLPERAHIGRINRVLRREIPIGSIVSARDMVEAYSEAYAVIGDYCGGGERLIRRELLGIVKATFRHFQLV